MCPSSLRKLLEEAPVHDSAPRLLGWHLVYGELRARLVEVEAYWGAHDPGSHAYRGPTPRNQVMFGPPGYSYVYFTYGNHWMLNVTARPEGEAGAVLLRAAEPLAGLETLRARRPKARTDRRLLAGPGCLAQAFGLDSRHYGLDLLAGGELRLEPGEPPPTVLCDRRIGLAPGKGDEKPWRFLDGSRLEWISRPYRPVE